MGAASIGGLLPLPPMGKTSEGSFGTACRLFETPSLFWFPVVRKVRSRKNGGEASGERLSEVGENRQRSRVGTTLGGGHDRRTSTILVLKCDVVGVFAVKP